MAGRSLTVELPEDLYNTFMETVTRRGGLWRSRRKKETAREAVQSAVCAALLLFLQGLDGEPKLPEFRQYARLKYPELDEDLINRRRGITACLRPRIIS